MNDAPDSLDELIGRLERAAEQLRSGELSTDAAATLVDECAALANRTGAELERRAAAPLAETGMRAEGERPPASAGQGSLLQ